MRMGRLLVTGLLAAFCTSVLAAQTPAHEPTDAHIRRLAGLPAESATGQIEIIDVGHDPMDTMLSIVANRTDRGWTVSYACAESPRCAPDVDHRAEAYTVSASAGVEIDAILNRLKNGETPDGRTPSPDLIGGHLLVAIDFEGFRRDYRRTGEWGKTLGRLEALLSPPAG